MKYELVQSSSALSEAIEVLSSCEEVSIDLEFDKNRFRFGFNLCLMQLAGDGRIFLIDPLAQEVEIAQVFPLLEDASIRKLAFEFGEDLRLLHSLGCRIQNLEDLSVASKLIGNEQLSLTNLLVEQLGIEPQSGSQMSNWFQRPLTNAQCAYAADDVRYLHQLRGALLKTLKGLDDDRFSWYEGENAFMTNKIVEVTQDEHVLQLKKEDRAGLNQLQYHALKALHARRVELARKYNRPVFKILSNPGLVAFVRSGIDRPTINLKEIGIKKLRTEGYTAQWKAAFRKAWDHGITCGLSEDEPAFLPLAEEEKQRRREEQREVNRRVDQDWKPVQIALRERYGAGVATYLLSNRLMKRLAADEGLELPTYRTELFNALRTQS